MEDTSIQLFDSKKIRTQWDAEQEKWYFSIVDIVSVLTESVDATAYQRKLKQRLKAEGNETVTNCHALKMPAADGKMRMTDVADQEQMFRLIQSIPSPKAEPIKRWIAQVASERIDEMQDPELAIERGYKQEKWLARQEQTLKSNWEGASYQEATQKVSRLRKSKRALIKEQLLLPYCTICERTDLIPPLRL